jgi:hypothetical protein
MDRILYKKFIWLAVVLLVLSGLGYVVFRIFNPSVGFAYYEPSYLPPNVAIRAKRISINEYASTQVEQNFRTEDWVYSIREYKATRPIGSAEQNYDDKSTEPTCSMFITPQKIEYRLCHWIDYGKINVHEVKFIKGTTFINTQIPTKVEEQISVEEISRFVDSFEKKSTVGLPVLRSSGA